MGCPLSKKFASLCHPFVVLTYLKCVYLVGVSVENSAAKTVVGIYTKFGIEDINDLFFTFLFTFKF